MVQKSNGKLPKKLIIEADIEAMSLDELRQWAMERRREARLGVEVLQAGCNNNCYDDMVKAILSLIPQEERANFKLGHFQMSRREILHGCNKYIDWMAEQGKVLPDKPTTIE